MMIIIKTTFGYDNSETLLSYLVDLNIYINTLLETFRCSAASKSFHFFFNTIMSEYEMRPDFKVLAFYMFKNGIQKILYKY